jgi:phage-related protein (TIGR01555 family)
MTTKKPTASRPEILDRKEGMKISSSGVYNSVGKKVGGTQALPTVTFGAYKPLPGVLPSAVVMAMDDASGLLPGTLPMMGPVYDFARAGAFQEGIGFMGYPYLAELAQRPEYRKIAEVLAEEMVREWIKITAKGEDDKSDKISKIEEELERLNVRHIFRRATEMAELFGRCQIFLDTGYGEDQQELQTPMPISKEKLGTSRVLKRLTIVDPTWTAPNDYNSTNPLNPTFFKPQSWFVMGVLISSTRMITFVPHEVPDILKPAYNFGGLSMSQMVKPYVDNFLRTRQSVSDLLHSFTVWILKTNLAALLSGGSGADEYNRADIFNITRDNRGLMMMDKDTEDLSNVSAPLGTLDHLQAQSQEQMASIPQIPLVKMFGITPSGLSTSTDGEVRTFYDHMNAKQEKDYRQPLKLIMDIIQLSEFGEIDPDIDFHFQPLWQLDESALATIRKTNSETDLAYVQGGIMDPDDIRATMAAEPESRYSSVDFSGPAPTPPAPEPQPGPDGMPPDDGQDPPDTAGAPPVPKPPGDGSPVPPKPAQDSDQMAQDRVWDESRYRRANNGKFASIAGGGAGGGEDPDPKPELSKEHLDALDAHGKYIKKYLAWNTGPGVSKHAELMSAIENYQQTGDSGILEGIKPIKKPSGPFQKDINSILSKLQAEVKGEASEPEVKEAVKDAIEELPTETEIKKEAQTYADENEDGDSMDLFGENDDSPTDLAVPPREDDSPTDDLPEQAPPREDDSPTDDLPEQAPPVEEKPKPEIKTKAPKKFVLEKDPKVKEVLASNKEEAKALDSDLDAIVEQAPPNAPSFHSLKNIQQEIKEYVKSGKTKNMGYLYVTKSGPKFADPEVVAIENKAGEILQKFKSLVAKENAVKADATAENSDNPDIKELNQTANELEKIAASFPPENKGQAYSFRRMIGDMRNYIVKGKVGYLYNSSNLSGNSEAAIAYNKGRMLYLKMIGATENLKVSDPTESHGDTVPFTSKPSHEQIGSAPDSEGEVVKFALHADVKSIPGQYHEEVTNAISKGGATSKDVDKLLTKMGVENYDKLKKHQIESIKSYQNGAYKEINKTLNGLNEGIAPNIQKKIDKHIENLNHAISKSHCAADIPVFRGINTSLEKLAGFTDMSGAVGRVFEHKNFASVSRKEEVSRRFSPGNTLMSFTVPAGARALTMASQYEAEMVLGTNSIFRIDKIDTNAMNHKTVVHCTYLGHKDGTPHASAIEIPEPAALEPAALEPAAPEPNKKPSMLEEMDKAELMGQEAQTNALKAYTKANLPNNISDLTKNGAQLGSNPGGKYSDGSSDYYVKQSKSDDHAHNEVLASKLYQLAGAPVSNSELIDVGGGKKGTITKWMTPDGKFKPNQADHLKQAQGHFGTHAWLGNWDAIGQENDNQAPINGKMHTIDVGGALKYRAQGGLKSAEQFGPEVKETASMTNKSVSPQAAAVFGKMSYEEQAASVERLKYVSPIHIRQLVHQHAGGTVSEKHDLANLLIARRADILAQYGHLGG